MINKKNTMNSMVTSYYILNSFKIKSLNSLAFMKITTHKTIIEFE